MKHRSVMEHRFSEIPRANIQRSTFDRSHAHKTAFDIDKLIPFYVDEALPGDTFKMNCEIIARLNTPVVPIMDNMFMDIFFFDVPWRQIWTNYFKFFGAEVDPGDSNAFTIPTVVEDTTGFAEGSNYDYFGLPTLISDITVSALPHRALHHIYNTWFRDENLQDSLTVDMGDGPDTYATYATVLTRGKRHDYFTSCLPWTQKADAAVPLSLGTTADVYGDNMDFDGVQDNANYAQVLDGIGGTLKSLVGGAASSIIYGSSTSQGTGQLKVDLTNATGPSVNDLRESIALQRMYERDARGGTRYTEIVKSHFGVTSPDSRLQRPELLGISSTPVQITPVANTEGATNEQGYLAGFGTVQARCGFAKSFTEHSVVMGIVNVRADITYQQGVRKMWLRSTRADHYWPELAYMGEQAVQNMEIWADGGAGDTGTFGYQERYAAYRYFPSIISGIFRSDRATNLDEWHLSQDFASVPTLNTTFISADTPLDRCVATPAEPHFNADCYQRLICARPMPLYGVPGGLGRL